MESFWGCKLHKMENFEGGGRKKAGAGRPLLLIVEGALIDVCSLFVVRWLFQQGRRVEVLALDVLEVAVGCHFEFHCRWFVGNDDSLLVELEG